MSPEYAAQSVVFTPLHASPAAAAELAGGYSRGYAAGWSAGSRAAGKEAETQRQRLAEETAARARQAADAAREALGTLAQAAAAARRRASPDLAEAQEQLTRGAVSLAEALLGAELRDDDASAHAALSRALSVPDQDVVRIRLHPDDLAHLTATLDSLPGDLRLPADVELVADAALSRGDAVSELTEGHLDARLTAAVARARAALGVG